MFFFSKKAVELMHFKLYMIRFDFKTYVVKNIIGDTMLSDLPHACALRTDEIRYILLINVLKMRKYFCKL